MKSKTVLLNNQTYKIRVYDQRRPAAEPVLWPSLGEYQVYDEFLYYIMTHDSIRNHAYRAAIQQHAPGRIVLDIGAGQDLNWARACIEAGAEKVYAIEVIEKSFRSAQKLAMSIDRSGKLIVIHGPSTSVELPEKVNLCVSEIIGTIGSSEGVAHVLNDARRRFLAVDGVMIPQRCVTRVAAINLPDDFHADPAFGKAQVTYVEKIFAEAGHPFDLRLCLDRLQPSCLLSTGGVFEDMDFTRDVNLRSVGNVTLQITRPGRLDGLLLWIHLWCLKTDTAIDSFKDRTNWLPVFLPIFYPGIPVESGDRLTVVCQVQSSKDGELPDYRVEGEVIRSGKSVSFEYDSPRCGRKFKSCAFYETLFS